MAFLEVGGVSGQDGSGQWGGGNGTYVILSNIEIKKIIMKFIGLKLVIVFDLSSGFPESFHL